MVLHVLLACEDINWQVAERFFIASASHFGFRLVNQTQGGEGTGEHVKNPRWRKNNKAWAKRKDSDPEYRAAYDAAMERLKTNYEWRENQRRAMSRLPDNPTWVANKKKAAKKLWAKRRKDPEYMSRFRERMRAAHRTPEARANHSAAAKLRHQTERQFGWGKK